MVTEEIKKNNIYYFFVDYETFHWPKQSDYRERERERERGREGERV
jgi:hypothetical protein